MVDGARDVFAQQFAALLADSGLQAKQAAARTNAIRPKDANWSVTVGLLSAWKTGRNLPSVSNQDGFFRVVRVLTEHARGRAASGHRVGKLLDEVDWTQALEQARAAVATTDSLPSGEQHHADMTQDVQHGSQGLTGSGRDPLPLVSDTDLEARVHRPVFELPYIRRDVEDEVELHLTRGRPVLLVGASMVGKTRMAGTIVRRMFATRRAVIPDTRNALSSLHAEDMIVRDSVIFLDDINRLMGPGRITDETIHRLVAADNIVIGTIRATEYDRLQPTDQLRPSEWDVLSAFERVFIERELSDSEHERLKESVSDPGTRERVQRIGLGEYVGAAERISDALRIGPEVNPTGYAIVLGVADWMRGGMIIPAPAAILPDLAAPHLKPKHLAHLSEDEKYQKAMAWATRDINPTVALLQQIEPAEYLVYDYALDLISGRGRPIPETTWPILIRYAGPLDLVRLGDIARLIYSQPQIAKKAYRQALNCKHEDAAFWAANGLGVVLKEEGDTSGAITAFRQAIDLGHKDAAMAKVALGFVFMDAGDTEAAILLFQQTVDTNHAVALPSAAFNLGFLFQSEGNLTDAKDAYQKAIESRHEFLAPRAAFNLGAMLSRQGDTDGAKDAYRQAIDSGLPDTVRKAGFSLGRLLQDQGDIEGAKNAYRLAINTGHKDAAVAMVALGSLLQEEGDTEGAIDSYRQAVNSGHKDALVNLGHLLEKRGDIKGAKDTYRQAMDSDRPIAVLTAWFSLGSLLQDQGDVEGAKNAYQMAINTGHEEAAWAKSSLGFLLQKEGDTEGAINAYQQTIKSGHKGALPISALNLGTLLDERGDIEGAKEAYLLAIDSGQDDMVVNASLRLGIMLRKHGTEQDVMAALRRVFHDTDAS